MPPLEHSLNLRSHQPTSMPDSLQGRTRAVLTHFIITGELVLGVHSPLVSSSHGVEMKKLIPFFKDALDVEFWMRIQLC